MNELDDSKFTKQQQITPRAERQRRPQTVNLEFINRLSTPKMYYKKQPVLNKNNKKRLRPDEILNITNRLHSANNHTVKPPVKKTSRKPHTDATEITERLQRPLSRPKAPSNTHQRGAPKEIHELVHFVERLSTPKKSAERTVDRNVQIERRNLNKEDIKSLCHRLADPSYARKRTPDTNRVLDRTFSPVNTYAWQGLPYNPIDWKIYFPQ